VDFFFPFNLFGNNGGERILLSNAKCSQSVDHSLKMKGFFNLRQKVPNM